MSPRTHRARPRAEALEGRSLLSHAAPHQSVEIQAPDTVFASDTTRINVTLTRSATDPTLLRKRFSYPLVANYDDSFDPPPLPLGVEKAAPFIRPDLKKSVTFRPGETTKTISLPLSPVPAGSPDYSITLGKYVPFGLGYAVDGGKSVKVYASHDHVLPTIIGTRLTPQGLALTFSKPMNPATVQDVKNYQVSTFSEDGSGVRSIALGAAVYDPATQTVTLSTTLPPGNNVYTVSIEHPSNSTYTPLTDLGGNPYNFDFNVTVRPS